MRKSRQDLRIFLGRNCLKHMQYGILVRNVKVTSYQRNKSGGIYGKKSKTV